MHTRRSRSVGLSVAVAVALGIGAAVAVLSVLQDVFVGSRPYAAADRLVILENSGAYVLAGHKVDMPELSWPDFSDLESQQSAFSDLGGIGRFEQTIWDTGDRARSVSRVSVTAHLMALLGARARVGRVLVERDFEPGAPAVAVVTEGLWRRQLGSDPRVVGRVVHVDGRPFTLVGVVADDVVGFLRERTSLFEERDQNDCVVVPEVPGAGGPRERLLAVLRANRGLPALTVVGRLRPGVSVASAEQQIRTIGQRLARAYPATNGGREIRGSALTEWRTRRVSHLRPMLLSAAVLALLVACASAIGLIVTDAIRRAPEMAVRHALGASRGRLVRLVLWRTLWWTLPGGALGVLLSGVALEWIGVPGLAGGPAVLLPAALVLLAGATGLTVLVALVLGGIAALSLQHQGLALGLQEGGHLVSLGRGRRRALALVVTVQIAAATSLGLVSGLLLRSMANILNVDMGFQAGQSFVVRVFLSEGPYRASDERSTFLDDALARVRALSTVASAGLSDAPPLSGVAVMVGGDLFLEIPGRPPAALGPTIAQDVTPGYFETIGMRMSRGRAFSDDDSRAKAPVIVVDEAFCREHLGSADPLAAGIRADGTLLRIVGVVRDVHQEGPVEGTQATLYLLRSRIQSNASFAHLVVRPSGSTREAMDDVVGTLVRMDPRVAVDEPQTLDTLFAKTIADRERTLRLIVLAVSIVFLLTAFSVTGALGEFVENRTREIGLRKALGASRRRVVLVVCRSVGLACAGGIVVGGFAGWSLAWTLSSELFGLDAGDPVSIAAALACVVALGVMAAAGPLRRAMAIDPASALRSL